MSALDVPGHVWVASLLAAAPLGDTAARIPWLRALAVLACTCSFFRGLISGSELDSLYTEIVVGYSPASGTSLLQALSTRPQTVRRLVLNCTAVVVNMVGPFLARLTSLRRLDVTGVDSAASAVLADVFCRQLPALGHLTCSGSAGGACQPPPWSLPAALTSLELAVPPLPQDFALDNPAWVGSVLGVPGLQTLRLDVSGPCNDYSAAIGHMIEMLVEVCSLAPPLSALTITQHISLHGWLRQGGDPADPVRYLRSIKEKVLRTAERALAKPEWTQLKELNFLVHLERDSSCKRVKGQTCEKLGWEASKEVPDTVTAWLFKGRFRFTKSNGQRHVDAVHGYHLR